MITMHQLRNVLLVGAGVMFAQPLEAGAQIRASELQTISQTVDGTTVTITYSRPRMRGRWPIFGTRAVQWGEVWTPGANYATILEVNKDITMAGAKVPAPPGGENRYPTARRSSATATHSRPPLHAAAKVAGLVSLGALATSLVIPFYGGAFEGPLLLATLLYFVSGTFFYTEYRKNDRAA